MHKERVCARLASQPNQTQKWKRISEQKKKSNWSNLIDKTRSTAINKRSYKYKKQRVSDHHRMTNECTEAEEEEAAAEKKEEPVFVPFSFRVRALCINSN